MKQFEFAEKKLYYATERYLLGTLSFRRPHTHESARFVTNSCARKQRDICLAHFHLWQTLDFYEHTYTRSSTKKQDGNLSFALALKESTERVFHVRFYMFFRTHSMEVVFCLLGAYATFIKKCIKIKF
jgi:hypothetical protein